MCGALCILICQSIFIDQELLSLIPDFFDR